MEILKFDLMRTSKGGMEYFMATMKYPHSTLFKFNIDDFQQGLYSQKPSLIGKPVKCYFYDDTKTVLQLN